MGYYIVNQCCQKVFVEKSTSVTLSDGNIQITLPNTNIAISNGDIIKMCVCQEVPSTNPLGTVSVIINGVTIPLWTKYHNNVRADQIKQGKCYYLGVGTEVPSLTVLNCIPKSGFSYPTIPVPTS